ncbi:hypothetical protein R1sor_023606 [Riccia sorocarpa]|uniref:Uncharacterized protein n=1 Tax=Riccia sorocarpa TaxID=122646 RepID=A0ABD3GRG0_9MARC
MERAIVGPPSVQSAVRIMRDVGQQRSSGATFGATSVLGMLGLSRWKKMDKVHKPVNAEGYGKSMMSVGVARALNSDTRPGSDSNAAVLMEIDGVLCDVHRHGNRQAFNLAFQDLGLDCAQWTEAVYSDLMRAAGGVEEKMLSTYFTRIGWPAALPTSEKELFVKKVIGAKGKALAKLALDGSLPLRPGLEEFIDEVLEAGVPLILISAYYKDGEELARILVKKLGEERAREIIIVNEEAVAKSAYGQLVLGEGVSSGFDEQLAAAAARAVAAEKQRLAEEVASMLKLSVEVDTTYSQMSKKAVAALRAAAELAERGVDRCVLLATGHPGAQAAQKIGMPCVVVRSSLTTRAEFPAAKGALDGYGPGAVTLSRLLKLLQ